MAACLENGATICAGEGELPMTGKRLDGTGRSDLLDGLENGSVDGEKSC